MKYLSILAKAFFSWLLVVVIVSLAITIIPGDFASYYFSEIVKGESLGRISSLYSKDEDFYTTFFDALYTLVTLDFGSSWIYKEKVLNVILDRLIYSAIIGLPALLVQLALAFYLALHFHDSKFLVNFLILMYVIPAFALAYFLVAFFSSYLNVLPASHTSYPGSWSVGTLLIHSVMPIFVLVFSGIAYPFEVCSETAKKFKESEFFALARLRGLDEKEIYRRYMSKHMLLPLVHMFALFFPAFVSGVLVIEIVFAWPGFGRLTYEAVLARDIPLILGITEVSATLVIVFTALADVVHLVLDPRLEEI